MESSAPRDPKQPFDFQPPPKPSGLGAGWVIAFVLMGVMVLSSCACVGILVALLLPAVQSAHQAARTMQSANNLKQIGLALHNYHTTHGVFPPAYIADENGKPMRSWRTAILPFIEQMNLYDMVDESRAWDDPANAVVRDMAIAVYHSPRDSGDFRFTNYLAITGEGTVLSGDQPTSIDDVRDGTSKTIMIVEVLNSDIEWSEPRDLDVSNIQRVDEGANPQARNVIPTGGAVLFADGSVRTLSAEVTREMLDIYLTRDGGEMSPDWPYDK